MPAASGTSLNTGTVQATGEYAPAAIGCIRKTLTFSTAVASTTAQVIGTLPNNAMILSGSGVTVTTAFDGTTPTLNVGYAADALGAAVAAAYASALAPTTVGTFVALDELLTATAKPRAIATTLTAAITYTNTTVGACDIIIVYAVG